MKIKTLILPLLAGLFLFSCKRDKIDFNMIDDLTLNPELEAPLVKAHLSLNDIVMLDSGRTLQTDPDNAVRIQYFKKDLFSFSALDFVKIPPQDSLVTDLVVGFMADADMSLGTLGGVELYQALLSDGFLKIKLRRPGNPLPSSVELKLTFKNATNTAGSIVKHIVLPGGVSSVEDSVDMTGVEFDFSNGGQSFNYLGISAEIINYDSSLDGEPLKLSVQLKNLGVENTRGYFGQRQINIPAGNFDFDISGLEKLFDGFYLKEPSVKLLTASTVGLGLELTPDFTGVNNEGEIISLDATPQSINAAKDVSIVEYDTIEFSAANSNIDEFLAILPREVLYSGHAAINAQGRIDTNFINKNSEINVGVLIDVPLELSIDNMKLEQELNDISLFDENPEEIESLSLIFYTSNGFPFNLDLSVAFLDKNAPHDSLHGFNLGLLTAATVDANGQILQRGEPAPQKITIEKDMLPKLKESNRIRFKASLSTKQDGQKIEKFYTNFDLEIKVAAQVKLNMKLTD